MRAVLDANVLLPLILRDTLLDAAIRGLYEPLWTEDILDELRRNLVENIGLSWSAAIRLTNEMTVTFPPAEVSGHLELVPAMTTHPKDRHVLAAAVCAAAHGIVTSNLRDFPPSSVAPYGIVPLSPDEFFRRLFAQSPQQMVAAITGLSEAYRRLPLSVNDILARLADFAPTLPRRYREARQ
jgi:predicted nucleic acid-binding protein